MLIETLFLGMLQVTAYRSVVAQTDDSPFYTSIGQHVHSMGCAASPDLLKSGRVKYGDYVCVDGLGCKVVNDTTSPRLTNTIDVWVGSYAEEKALKPSRRQVIRIRGGR